MAVWSSDLTNCKDLVDELRCRDAQAVLGTLCALVPVPLQWSGQGSQVEGAKLMAMHTPIDV